VTGALDSKGFNQAFILNYFELMKIRDERIGIVDGSLGSEHTPQKDSGKSQPTCWGT
jgi:hypothetical protein